MPYDDNAGGKLYALMTWTMNDGQNVAYVRELHHTPNILAIWSRFKTDFLSCSCDEWMPSGECKHTDLVNDDHLGECADCETLLLNRDQNPEKPSGETICHSCRDDNYLSCDGCDNLTSINSFDAAQYRDCLDATYCDECFRDHGGAWCDECSEEFYQQNDDDGGSEYDSLLVFCRRCRVSDREGVRSVQTSRQREEGTSVGNI